MTPCITNAPFSVFSSFTTYSIFITSNIFFSGGQQWQRKSLIQAVKILGTKWNDIGHELTIKETTICLINSSSIRNCTHTSPLLTNVDNLCCFSATHNFTVSRQWVTILGYSVLLHRHVSTKNSSLSLDKVAMDQVILPTLLPSSVRFVPPVVRMHSFT